MIMMMTKTKGNFIAELAHTWGGNLKGNSDEDGDHDCYEYDDHDDDDDDNDDDDDDEDKDKRKFYCWAGPHLRWDPQR